MSRTRTALGAAALVTLGALALAIGACGSSDDSSSGTASPAASEPGKTVEVKAVAPSDTLSVRVGDTIEVAVAGNPTTGYQWELVQSDDDAVEQAGEPAFEPESDAEGAPGTVTIPMKAVKTGSAIIVLKEMPPGEAQGTPAGTCVVSLDVEKADGAGAKTVKAEVEAQESVEAGQGDTLEVKLPGNASTGYSWMTDTRYIDDAVLTEEGEPQYEADSEEPGSPGVFTLEWKVGSGLDDGAESPKDAIVITKYVAPGDQKGVPESVWSVWVTVK